MATPKLRFKDGSGRDFPALEKKLLGEFTEQIKRKSTKQSTAPVMMISAEKGFIYQKDRYSRNNAGRSLANYTLLKQGEFAYNHGYSKIRIYGSVFLLKEDEARVPFVYHCFKLLSGVKEYWAYYLNSGIFDRTLKKLITSTARMDGLLNIKYESYMSMIVNVPSLAEQKKIADFLSSYDALIENQSKSVEVLKLRKKGLLQKIFSQEIRFKDANGQDFPQWEEKRLENVVSEISSGKSCKAEESNYPLYGSTGIIGHSMTPDYIGNKLIIARVGACGTARYVSIPCGISDNALVIEENKAQCDLKWLYYSISQRHLERYAIGSAQPLITSGLLKRLYFYFPSLPEQRIIADFLTSVDKQIDVEEKRLETMKTIKKGLLQQLFV